MGARRIRADCLQGDCEIGALLTADLRDKRQGCERLRIRTIKPVSPMFEALSVIERPMLPERQARVHRRKDSRSPISRGMEESIRWCLMQSDTMYRIFSQNTE